jgi:ornithine carbamoyltransferase
MRAPGELKGFKLAYLGDGNNMAHSWMLAAAMLGIDLRIASPAGYEPLDEFREQAAMLSRSGGGRVSIMSEPRLAVAGADAVYTDVWTSMGQEEEAQKRRQVFGPYQMNAAIMSLARKDAMVMHCLPAHRGEEITEDVLEGPNSVVFDQAENRLHVQKAVLLTLMKGR